MKVAEYLRRKYRVDTPSTLSKREAVIFGIPYPLRPGWLAKHGDTEITDRMISWLKQSLKAKGKKSLYAARGLNVLDGKQISSMPDDPQPLDLPVLDCDCPPWEVCEHHPWYEIPAEDAAFIRAIANERG